MIPTQEELGDNLCLPSYCPYIKEGGSLGVHGGPNGPYSCEGRFCPSAYEKWKDDNVVTCEVCEQSILIEQASEFTDDCHKYYLCDSCMKEGE